MSTSAGRVMPLPKGAYSSETTYHILDMVSFGNGTFICKQTSTGNEPSFDADTDYWQLIARSGDVAGVKGDAETDYRDGNVNISFENIISGALPVSKGGTGRDSHTANSVLTGNGSNGVIDISTDSGALYATTSGGTAQFGTLPIAQGGTGAVSASAALTNLGAVGTTGASTNTTVTYTTKDAAANTTEKTNTTTDQPSTVAKLTSGETLASMFSKISAMFKNIRRLWNTVGSTALQSNKTITGLLGSTTLDTAYGATLTAQMANLKSYNTYSTSETWTGKYWTDGKKIYRKTYTLTLANGATVTTEALDNLPTNFSELISLTGATYYFDSSETFEYPISHYFNANDYMCVWIRKNAKKIVFKRGGTSKGVAYATIEYTKTTN